MCNHYRNEPEKIPTWRQYIGYDIAQPNLPFENELWPKKSGLVVRDDSGAIRGDVMLWGIPRAIIGKSGKPLEKRVTNIRNLNDRVWKSSLANPTYRCLVPFSEFAEPKIGQGRDEWWFSIIDQPLAAFAGVWRDTQYGRTYAFLTCDPNPLVAPLHPKAMPVILAPDDYSRWLKADYADACALAKPYPYEKMAVR